ncbi:hypothetical protein LJB78_00650 [Bacteroidales bacterium OttesenSCG-928-J16]|nr:hypothetical protein [Bacteroidales bacterium OttesenSCG-928-J16]
MKRTVIISLIVIFFSSCGLKKNEPNAQYIYYSIDNIKLKEEILLYCNSEDILNSKNFHNAVQIDIFQFSDTTQYHMFPLSSIEGLTAWENTVFSKVDSILIAFTYMGTPTFSLPDSLIWEMAKDFFPEEYARYKEAILAKRDRLIIDILSHDVEWVLRFNGEEFIDRRIYRYGR